MSSHGGAVAEGSPYLGSIFSSWHAHIDSGPSGNSSTRAQGGCDLFAEVHGCGSRRCQRCSAGPG